jgi:hypothetical protein
MDIITQTIMKQLTGGTIASISKKIGVDPNTLKTALAVGAPLLVSALARNASKPAGAESLHQALANDHDGSILDDIKGFLKDPAAANGAGILGHVLGNQQPAIAQGMAKTTGMNADQVAQLLQIAAPLVMGALGAQQQKKELDPQGLAGFLGGQVQKVQKSQPNVLNTINGLLDTNKDGSGLDEVLGLAGKLFGGKK